MEIMVFVTTHKSGKFYLFNIFTGAEPGWCYPITASIIEMYQNQLLETIVSSKGGLWSLKCSILK